MSFINLVVVNRSNVLFKLFNSNRQISSKFVGRCFSDKSAEISKVSGGGERTQNPNDLLRNLISPTEFQKKTLVWTGRYSKIEDVPDKVSPENLDKAKNKMRIKVCNYMIIGTLIGCILMSISGRRAVQRGESLQKMNLDWHKEMNKKLEAEKALIPDK